MTTIYPLSAVRALALYAQGLSAPNDAEAPPEPEEVYRVVAQLGCVQMDTLQMVHRSHYLVLWSRLGRYDPAAFDRLIYHPEQRRLFEGWQHAACIIPLDEYRYQMPHQRQLREGPGWWFRDWFAQPENAALLPAVLERVRQEGAVRAADFEYRGPKRGSWWDWKPAKTALEYLYAFGDLMIADRVNFQRVYDLTERIMPAWVDQTEPTLQERDRRWIEQGAQALGICQPAHAADYAFRKRTLARPYLDEFLSTGVFVPVSARLVDGKTHTLVVHRQSLALLEQAADGGLNPSRTTFLSPFDNLFWARGRDMQFWGFRNVLEAYKPEPQREWGYFCLPILHKDQLVGRFDPKLERRNSALRLKTIYLEPGIEPDEELLAEVAQALRDFMAFHEAKELTIERSDPIEFGRKLESLM